MKPGDKVKYIEVTATVLHVRDNGITIGFWGKGLKDGQYVKRRVSRRHLVKI